MGVVAMTGTEDRMSQHVFLSSSPYILSAPLPPCYLSLGRGRKIYKDSHLDLTKHSVSHSQCCEQFCVFLLTAAQGEEKFL